MTRCAPDCPRHHCHALKCRVHVEPELLMCHPHWDMVPEEIRERVLATYQPGQCDMSPPPSKEWFAAADDAIKAVYAIECEQKAKEPGLRPGSDLPNSSE